MAVAYDIKAKPTVYGARQFRSRLEAKWASFFDLCGWQYEYEPYDLGAWSPDFLLLGTKKVLVEVKPITVFDADTQSKMETAASAAGWDGELMLVGVAPGFSMRPGPFQSPTVGWLAENGKPYGSDAPSWFWGAASACLAPSGSPDFTHDELDFGGRMFGHHYKENDWPHSSDWLKRIWDRAANRVQWHKQ